MPEQSVLITGASRGIGNAVAKKLSSLGYKVTGTSRHPQNTEDDGMAFIPLDLADESSIENCIAQAGDIDILINNAGISQIGAVEELPVEKFKELFQVNLFGLMKLTQAFLPQMRKRKKGFIINIGSLAGRFAVPFQSSYVASKFALEGFSWSLRNEVKQYGIKVVVVQPNDISTAIEPETFMKEDSPYKKSIDRLSQHRSVSMAGAPGAEIVANKIVEILKMKSPKPFYAVGKNASLMLAAKRFVSNEALEKMIRSNYGLE